MARIHIIRPASLATPEGTLRATYCGMKGFFHMADEYDTVNGDRFEAPEKSAGATCQRCVRRWEAWHDKRGSLARQG